MMQGGAHALVSVVRVRLSSASSVPLKRAQSAAPSARPALDSPLCARDATVQLDCSSSTNSSSETRRGLELSSAEVSTEPDPDGRLVRRPESRRSADLTSFGTKGQISTYLRLDQTCTLQRAVSGERAGCSASGYMRCGVCNRTTLVAGWMNNLVKYAPLISIQGVEGADA